MPKNTNSIKLHREWKILLFLFILVFNLESVIPTLFTNTLTFYFGGLLVYLTILYFCINEQKFSFFPPTAISYLILTLTIITIFSACLGLDFYNSIPFVKTMISFMVIYVIIYNITILQIEDSTKFITKIIVVTISIPSLVALSHILKGKVGLFSDYGIEYFRISGTYREINVFSTVLSLSLPLSIAITSSYPYRKKKLLWAIATILISVAMILTISRATIIASAIGLIWLLLRMGEKRYIWLIFIAGFSLIILQSTIGDWYLHRFNLLMAGAYMPEDIFLRIASLRNGWNMFLQNPFFGIGACNFSKHNYVYNKRLGIYYTIWPHNAYLGLLVERGILGLLCFILIIGIAFHSAFKSSDLFKKQGNTTMSLLLKGYEAFLLTYSIRIFFIDSEHLKLFWFILPVISAIELTQKYLSKIRKAYP